MIIDISKKPKTVQKRIQKKADGTYKDYGSYPPVNGIYFWMNEDKEIVYIGTSTNVWKKRQRYMSHWDQERWAPTRPIFRWLISKRESTIYFDWVQYEDINLMYQHEEEFIKFYKPILNATDGGKSGGVYLSTRERIKKYEKNGF